MAHAILMPKPGQMTEECTVVAWLKAEGDPVAKGDVLFEIETDKSTMEVEAFDEGVLLRIVAPVGTTVPVNQVCAWVGQAGEEVPDAAPVAPSAHVAPAAAQTAAAVPEPGPATAAAAAPADRMAAPSSGGPARPAQADVATATTAGGRLRISPRAGRAAADAGIDPRTITGTGPGGRITEKDVLAAAGAAPASVAPAPAAAAGVAGPATARLPGPGPVDGEEEPRPLSRMRRVIAERLTASWTSTPHFTVTVAVDVTRVLALRSELKAAGTSLTVTDFVLAATAQTLAEFGDVNSRTDGVMVWPRRRVHLGVAVSVPGGLVVPVIRDADRLTLVELHDQAAALAVGARSGTLSPDALTGSTFTVSNLGMLGVEEFSAIINPGEAAILAVSSAIPTVVAIGDGMAIRTIMKLTLSADHRLVDGELGARFLGALRRRLEDAAAFRDEVARS
jgi:pyruvate dehydrogenase E2 component (dihydrolipoamide acetyltransferase)